MTFRQMFIRILVVHLILSFLATIYIAPLPPGDARGWKAPDAPMGNDGMFLFINYLLQQPIIGLAQSFGLTMNTDNAVVLIPINSLVTSILLGTLGVFLNHNRKMEYNKMYRS
ncbi:MAG: hypothetical protein ACLQVD_02775 [Capsulimonadaceae bacterium]